MQVKKSEFQSAAIKITIEEDGKEVGRAFLYILKNDLHPEPSGFMEDVFVEEEFRRQGIGRKLVQAVIAEARARGCYKLLATSRHERPEVHEFYKKFGFRDYGLEFRTDLT